MSIRSIVPTARSGSTGKLVSAREAVRLIRIGDTVAIGGFFCIGLALEVIHELGALFEATDEESAAFGKPRDLTLVFCVSPGDAQSAGANRLAQPGLVKRIIGGHWTGVPALYQLVAGNQVEGYNMPLGPMSHLYRDIAAGKPGHLSRVGLGTFADPRFGGGKLNEMATEDLVELVGIGGQEYLFYKAFPVNVAIIRGTTADPAGNITMEREALTCDTLSLAMAAHNSGGLVIAQVERLADVNSLNPRQVKIPGALVDCIVVATDPGNHPQTFASPYSPAFAAEVRVPLTSLTPMPMSDRKIIARRAAMGLRANSVVNLGYGIPEGVASVAAEEKIADLMTLTAEPGAIGGVPAGGGDFGAATNPQAIIDMPYQFDFYDGGGLDAAFLGLAQADREGNVNVSRFGPRLAGAGGFIDISQNAQKVLFLGTFTAGDLEVSVVEGKLLIERDGQYQKFVEEDGLRLPLDARFTYDDERNILYLNFEDLQVKSMTVIEDFVAKIREICGPLGHKLYAVVNYDGFELDSDLEDAYLDAVQEMGDTYFHGVTRFTTSAFMRAKLGGALESRGVAPHIYESEGEAAGAVRTTLPRQE